MRALTLMTAPILGLFLASSPCRAASAEQSADGRWAVIIGVDHYDDPDIGALRYASADAHAVAQQLVGTGSWRADHIVLLTSDADDAHKPTRNNILTELRWLESLPQADTVLFYFSGHGSRESTDGVDRDYLYPKDTLVLDPAASGLSVDDVTHRLEALSAPRKLIVLDACRNQTRAGTRAVIRPMSWAPQQVAEGTYVLLATRPGEYSYEEARLGMGRFTHAFTAGLAGGADGALGSPPDGEITIQELFQYTQRQLALSGEEGRPQTPWFEGHGTSDWALARRQAASHPGHVALTGDASRVWLESIDRQLHDPADPIAPGTYRVRARFGTFSEVEAGEVEIVADRTTTLQCSQRFLSCKVVPDGEAAP